MASVRGVCDDAKVGSAARLGSKLTQRYAPGTVKGCPHFLAREFDAPVLPFLWRAGSPDVYGDPQLLLVQSSHPIRRGRDEAVGRKPALIRRPDDPRGRTPEEATDELRR
jgi:hypothetical protein